MCMGEENMLKIIDIIFEFADNQSNNINNRLTASGMFWSISDHISRFAVSPERSNSDVQMSKIKSESSADSTPANALKQRNLFGHKVDHTKLWKRMFEKLYSLASCSQIEVRKHSLK